MKASPILHKHRNLHPASFITDSILCSAFKEIILHNDVLKVSPTQNGSLYFFFFFSERRLHAALPLKTQTIIYSYIGRELSNMR